MIIWGALALSAILAVVVVVRVGKIPRGAVELVVAAGLVGMAGYAWQGMPDQPGVSVQNREAAVPPDVQAVIARRTMTNNYSDAAKVAEFADRLDELGLTREAVIAVKTGIRKTPDDPELWVALGNTLVAHGGGMISPAAELAYNRAASLSPQHPAPAFFMGVALAQSGRAEEAAKVWRTLLNRTPKDAPWRAALEERIAAIDSMPAVPG